MEKPSRMPVAMPIVISPSMGGSKCSVALRT